MTQLGPDSRLQALSRDLAAGRYKALSLDVFDTMLWRRVPEPSDIFYQVGQSLKNSGALCDWVSVPQFAQLRAAAEKVARAQREAQTGSREVLLADIYAALPDHVWQDARALDGVAAEIEQETIAMVLDPAVANLIDVARRANVQVLLTSDTYFTREELVRFLSAAGLPPEQIPETLYISNEHGRPKWRDLFDVVLADLSLDPEQLIHLGDNVDADVTPCVMRGISHVFYDKWPALPRSLALEFPKHVSARAAWIAGGGDGGLTGLRSRLAHRSPEDLPADHRPYWVYGATALAPLFAAYTSWVVGTTRELPQVKIFGIMREGRFLARLVSGVAKQLGSDLPVDEVWLSRRAVVRAALWPDDLSLLPQAISYCPGPSTDDVLSQLGLTRADLVGVFKDPALFDFHAPDGMQAFLTGVSRSAELQTKLTNHSAGRRKTLLSYVANVFGSDQGASIVLLDLGYAGTIQSVLQKIMQREGVSSQLTGLYVAVNAKGRDNVLAGADLRALIDTDGYDTGLTALLERTPDILEHACMCPEGSLDEISENGAPELLPSQRPASQIAQMEAMQEGILAGVNAVIATLGQDTVSNPAFLQHAAEIVKQAMLYPAATEIATVGSWLHEANFDLSDQRALADLRVDPASLEFGGPKVWSSLERHEAYWPQAALARLSPTLAHTAGAISEGRAEARDFSSGESHGSIVIVPDIGVGPDERQAVSVPLETSILGRGEIQVEIKPFGPQAFQALELRWPAGASVIRIEQCAVMYRGERDQSVEDVAAKVSFKGDGEMRGREVRAGATGGATTIELENSIPPWPHSLSLLLRFSYLKLGPIIPQ